MRCNGGIKGANKVVRILSGIENCNGSFREIWQRTGLQREDLEGELEVLQYLGFVAVVPRGEQSAGRIGGGRRRRPVTGRTGAAYRVTEKGKRAFLSFD